MNMSNKTNAFSPEWCSTTLLRIELEPMFRYFEGIGNDPVVAGSNPAPAYSYKHQTTNP